MVLKMKFRIVLAVIMLFFAISFCVVAYFITSEIHEQLIYDIEKIEEYILINDRESATTLSLEVEEKWSMYHRIFSIFIHHSQLERCEVAIKSIYKYINIDDYLATLIMCEDAKICLNQLFEAEKTSLWNIL